LIQRLLFRPSWAHCDQELAVEVRRRKEEEEGRPANIKSNNPHLTGAEKIECHITSGYQFEKSISYIYMHHTWK